MVRMPARLGRAMVTVFVGAILLTSMVVRAETAPAANQIAIGSVRDIRAGDTAWMLTSAGLVLMMTGPGLALFYGGLVRRKNVLSTMMQSFILMAIVSVVWAVVGYSLAFDTGTAFIGGFHFAFLRNVGAAPCEYAPQFRIRPGWPTSSCSRSLRRR